MERKKRQRIAAVSFFCAVIIMIFASTIYVWCSNSSISVTDALNQTVDNIEYILLKFDDSTTSHDSNGVYYAKPIKIDNREELNEIYHKLSGIMLSKKMSLGKTSQVDRNCIYIKLYGEDSLIFLGEENNEFKQYNQSIFAPYVTTYYDIKTPAGFYDMISGIYQATK